MSAPHERGWSVSKSTPETLTSQVVPFPFGSSTGSATRKRWARRSSCGVLFMSWSLRTTRKGGQYSGGYILLYPSIERTVQNGP